MSTTSPAANVPKLRFPGFEGEWNSHLMDHFAVRGSGHTPSKSHPHYYGGGIQWISLADSKRLDKGYVEETNNSISEAGLRHSSAVLHPAGTVVLSRDAGVGKSAVMKHAMAVSQHFIAWRPIDQVSNSWFIYYWLQVMKPRFENIAIGNTIKTIGLPYFRKLQIVAPSFPEQQKIAGFLTAVDGRIEQLSRKKALLEATKKGVMQQLFTQTLRFQDDHGHDFPDWEEKTFDGIYSFKNTNSLSRDQLTYEAGEVRNIHYGDIHTKFRSLFRLSDENVPFIKPDISISKIADECYCRPGDLVIADVSEDYADVGKCIEVMDLNGEKTVAGLHTFIARPKKGQMAPGFGAYLMQSRAVRHRIMIIAQGTKVLGISKPQLSKMKLLVPHPDEQKKIAGFLSALDGKIAAVGEQLSLTQAWKKGLLQQLFV